MGPTEQNNDMEAATNLLRTPAEADGCSRPSPAEDVTLDGCDVEQEAAATILDIAGTAKNEDDDEHAFDRGGYGWMVCFACFLGQFMYSLGLSFGLFNIVLLEYFGRSKVETALVGSVCYGMTAGMGVLSGILANRIGHRLTCIIGSLLCTTGHIISAFTPNLTVLYFSYGVMIGTGVSMMALAVSVMVNFYFKKYRNLATGIMMTGSAGGSLIFPLMIEYFIDAFSWRGALLLLAGISLQGCVIGALLRPNELRKSTTTGKERKSNKTFHFSLFRKWTFASLVIICFTMGLSASIFFTISPHRLVTYGFTMDQAAFMLFLTGIASTASTVFYGVVFHFFRLNTSLAFIVAFAGMGIAHLVLAFSLSGFWVVVLVALVFGAPYGLMAYTLPLYVVSLFGLDRVNSALGFIVVGEGIGGLIGPSLAGFIYDTTGDYQAAFFISSSMIFIGCLLNIPVYFYTRRKQSKDKPGGDRVHEVTFTS